MTDEQRLEETTENLDELNDDVEAHRRHIADEEKSPTRATTATTSKRTSAGNRAKAFDESPGGARASSLSRAVFPAR